MPQDRIMCKECGTTDSAKFTIFENAFRCNVCGSINPFYDRFDILKMQHTGEVKVDGVASTESLLFNARQHLDECNYDKALSLYKKVIEITPKSHVAWWGCYCCEKGIASYYHYRDKYGNSGAGVKANILTELILKYGKKAIDYAPEEYSEAYRKALEPDIQFIDEVAGN